MRDTARMTGDVTANRTDTEEGDSLEDRTNSRWWHDHAVGLFTAAIVVLLCGVGATAVTFLFLYWDDAAGGKREIEVVKTCLQVLGVVLVVRSSPWRRLRWRALVANVPRRNDRLGARRRRPPTAPGKRRRRPPTAPGRDGGGRRPLAERGRGGRPAAAP